MINFIKVRVENLDNVVVKTAYLVEASVMVVTGVALSALALITFERSNQSESKVNISKEANERLSNITDKLQELFRSVMYVIKPGALVVFDGDESYQQVKVLGPIYIKANKCFYKEEDSDSPKGAFARKHIASRILYAAHVVVSIGVRISELFIAVITVPLAMVTCGKSKKLNSLAYKNLRFVAIIPDVIIGIRASFFPSILPAVRY